MQIGTQETKRTRSARVPWCHGNKTTNHDGQTDKSNITAGKSAVLSAIKMNAQCWLFTLRRARLNISVETR